MWTLNSLPCKGHSLSSEVGATRSTKTYMSIKFNQEVDLLRHSTLSSWENSSEALMKYHSWSAILMSRSIHTKWVIWHSADKSNTEILDKLTPIREDNLKKGFQIWMSWYRKSPVYEHARTENALYKNTVSCTLIVHVLNNFNAQAQNSN